jgi:hypothetical protein
MTPERLPDARQNTQTAPDPELHLSEDSPIFGPVDAAIVFKRNRPSLGSTFPDRGNSPKRSPRPDEFVAEKLDS